jgi:ubiquinone/menaquinone biosynthesis C-methylase UbiE
MDDREVGKLWEGSAEAWTHLSRAGYDVYRDQLNTPAFLAMLPEVAGLRGLDVGCGEAHNTRLVARRGACMTGLDIAPTFIRHAREAEEREPLGIVYVEGSALAIPFGDGSFDFAVAFLSLMDMPEVERAIGEVHRILVPRGFFQFSITHPFLAMPHRRNLRGPDGRTYAHEVGGYFQELRGDTEEWSFGAAPPEAKAFFPKFKTPRFTRTLSGWLNALLDAGFAIERLGEPCPSDETARACPHVQDAQIVPYFLHVRVRKPA